MLLCHIHHSPLIKIRCSPQDMQRYRRLCFERINATKKARKQHTTLLMMYYYNRPNTKSQQKFAIFLCILHIEREFRGTLLKTRYLHGATTNLELIQKTEITKQSTQNLPYLPSEQVVKICWNIESTSPRLLGPE